MAWPQRKPSGPKKRYLFGVDIVPVNGANGGAELEKVLQSRSDSGWKVQSQHVLSGDRILVISGQSEGYGKPEPTIAEQVAAALAAQAGTTPAKKSKAKKVKETQGGLV